MGWAIVSILAALLLFELLIQIHAVKEVLSMMENSPPFYVEDIPADPDAERISFSTPDGLTLRGSLHQHEDRPVRGLIVFCNEFGANHWSAMSYCEGLWEAGFDILTFDFRNQGDSDRMESYEPLHWLTDYEVEDVMAALDFVRQHDELRRMPLGLFGISRGAGAALVAAARSTDVQCAACEGAFSSNELLFYHARRWISLCIPEWLPERLSRLIPVWHIRLTLSLVRWVSQIRRGCHYTHFERWLPRLRDKPMLLICGDRDSYVLPEVTKDLYRRIAGGVCELWVVGQAKHNMARHIDPIEYDARIVDFFSELGPSSESSLTKTAKAQSVERTSFEPSPR